MRVNLAPPTPVYDGLPSTWFWITSAAAVALFATGGVFGAMALGERGDVDSAVDAGPESADYWRVGTQGERDDIRSLSLCADIFFAAGTLVAIGALIVAFLTDFDGPDLSTEAPAEPQASLFFDRHGAGLVLAGSL
jgi:hypothetical protein